MIPLYKVFMPDGIDEELKKILYSGKITYGENASLFERKLQAFVGNPKLLTTSTSNHALQIAFDILDLPVGSEVLASPMSCLASTQPILTNKLKIKWIDIDPFTGSINPEEVKKNITSNTKAILHYHWCGYPGYIDEINDIAKENSLFVVEDASEAFGAKYKNNYIGNTGSDIACFNFGPVRLPNTIEGGAISFNSEDLYQKALLMRDYGIDRRKFRDRKGEINSECDIPNKGYGAMMNEISGVIGVKQMEHIASLLGKQNNNGNQYMNYFNTINEIKTIDKIKECTPSYWVFSMLVNERDRVLNDLRANQIFSSTVHLRNDLYSCFNTYRNEKLKGTDYFAKHILSIPSGWWVNGDTISKIEKLFI